MKKFCLLVLALNLVLVCFSCGREPKAHNSAAKPAGSLQPTQTMYNTAKGGLIVRARPDMNSEALGKIRYAEIVPLIETVGESVKIQNISGRWGRIHYKDKEAYVFTGFLSPDTSFLCLEVESLTRLPLFEAACLGYNCEDTTSCLSGTVLFSDGTAEMAQGCHQILPGTWIYKDGVIVATAIFRESKDSVMYPTDCRRQCKDEKCYAECVKTAKSSKTTIEFKRLSGLEFSQSSWREELGPGDIAQGSPMERFDTTAGCLRTYTGRRRN